MAARVRGEQAAIAGAGMPSWFRQHLNDLDSSSRTRQQMLQASQQHQMVALQDRQRDTFQQNYRDLVCLKRGTQSEMEFSQCLSVCWHCLSELDAWSDDRHHPLSTYTYIYMYIFMYVRNHSDIVPCRWASLLRALLEVLRDGSL